MTKEITNGEKALALLQAACAQMEPMTPAQLREWQKRMGLTGRGAARLLGMSATAYLDRVNGKSYTTGQQITVSRVITLACTALEAVHIANSQR